ncbi:filamentous hemagglutinin N-terminal domain-containing protein, partial [[Pasteurella] aerogenes]
MNKKCFRVIFSKTLQRLVVTSELAKSESKSTESSAFGLSQIFAQIRPLTFSLYCALGFVAFSDSALANLIIQADKSAPKNQQPIVLQTANGLPQVNIQTPNDKGLSHNKYSKFDVDTKGAILNNSRTNVQTQQGGLITGNPYLAKGEAKVILNEVNSSDPSVLKGYVEVAGKKADVIIANPSGIHCEGCGVINSDRATFTTGKPQIKNGNLESFVVEKGKVKVSGKGLDNSRVDYTEIIARETQINAGVWSKKEAKVVTGKNTVKRSESPENLQIVHTNQPLATESQPQFAIDVGELGGMYSGKIHLIGTEHGVGVHNAGHIGASADTLHIDSQGRIVNKGTLNAHHTVELTGSKGIENRGKIENRQGNITLNTASDIQQDGSIVARSGHIHQTANQAIHQQGETVAKGRISYKAPKVTASTSSLIAAGVAIQDTPNGETRTLEKANAQGQSIVVNTSDKTTLQGKVLASNVQVNAASANLDHSQIHAYTLNVQAKAGNIQADNAVLMAEKTLNLTTPTQLQTQNSVLKAETLTTQQRSLNTNGATWEQTGKGELKLNVADKLQNRGGTFKTQGDLTVNAQGMDNQQGRFIAKGKLTVNAAQGKVDSTQGVLVAEKDVVVNSGEWLNDGGLIQSSQNVTINTQGKNLSNQQTFTDSQDKGIVALGQLDVQSSHFSNQQGRVVSGKSQNLRTADLNNQQGFIYTQQDLRVAASNLENHQGVISSAGNATLTIQNYLAQEAGKILSDGHLSVTATTLQSTHQSTLSANQLDIATQSMSNNASKLLAKQALTISSHALDNTKGEISSYQNTVNINTHQQRLNNNEGKIRSKSTLTIQSGELDNTQGAIHSESDIVLNAQQQQLNNTQGQITAKGKLAVNSGELQNQAGLLHSEQDITINTHGKTLNNQQTQGKYQGILALGNVTIDSGKLDNSQGVISAKSAQLNSATLTNRLGRLQSNEDLSLTTQHLENSQGIISGAKKVTLTVAKSLQQTAGQIGAGELALNAGSLQSTEKSVIAADNATLTVQQALTNTDSEISATHHLAITSQALDNQRGLLLAEQGNLMLNSQQQQLNNQHGKVVANQQLQVESGVLNNQDGLVQGKTGVSLNTYQQSLDNTLGVIKSEADLRLNAGVVRNHQGVVDAKNLQADLISFEQERGVVQANQSLNLTASGQISSTNHSLIQSENLQLKVAGQLDNQQSEIIAKQNATLNSGQLNNNQAAIVAEGGDLEIATHQQALTNQQGKLSAGANLALESGDLDNTAGLIQSRQNMTIHTHQGNLNNQQTQVSAQNSAQNKGIIALGELALTTQNLLNQQGYLLSQQAQTLNARKIENESGVLASLSGQKVTVRENIANRQGRISGESTTITAQAIDNQAGLLQGSQDLTVQAQGNLNNAKGQIKAQTALEVAAHAIHNREGQIRATAGELSLTAVSDLDNTLGNITAKQQATVEAKALNNQQGLVYNEQGLLHLNVKQALDNANGSVISKDEFVLKSDSLNNQQGTLYAENQGNIHVNGLLDNRQLGKIHGLGEMAIQANQMDNRGGEIRTQHKLALNATADINNQKVSNTGSFIESGNVLSIHTAQLNNSQTKSTNEKMAQGILASALTISAQAVDNQQGKMHSRVQGDLQIQSNLNNQQGEITGGGNLTIQGKALTLNNQDGRLQAMDSLSLFADEVMTNGHIEGRDITIRQQKDFVTNNHINANRSLSISTAGNLTNQHNLYTDEQLTLNANHITNRIDGRISSANTQISAKGDLTNEGLINSVSVDENAQTVIKVGGRLTNTGKGRIYGDNIALQADKFENSDKDYGNGEILSAVVAARGRLDIGAREIENNTGYYLSDNQVGATLFSVGDMSFGRLLNGNNQVEGKAEVLRNNSSVIESESRIRFGVDKVYNNNTHFTVAHVKNGEKVTEITKVSENPLNETYIIPMHRDSRGNLPTYYKNDKGEDFSKISSEYKHIPMELLRWAGWSRAGQLVYNLNNIEPAVLSAGETIRPDMLLASRNQMRCDSYSDGAKNCTYIPAGNYGLDNPIWTYAGVSAPSRPSPTFSFDELASQGYKEEDWFSLDPKTNELDIFNVPEEPGVAPEKPVRLENESEADFQVRMDSYQQALSTYTKAQKKWDYYQNRIKPYNDWVEENEAILDVVDKKIEEHNQNLSKALGQQYFRDFWQITLKNHRVDESKVLTTVAGQIIAGGNLEANSQSFINDRSVVIAGQDMLLENKIENIDEEGLHRITDTGDKVFTFDKWRGGFKRYFQRKWKNSGDYTRIIETPFDMNIFRVEENADYAANKQTSDKLKAQTEHQLSLSKVSVNNDALSSTNELELGTLNGGDSAHFTQLNSNTRQIDSLNVWEGKGQQVESQIIDGQLDAFHALRDTTLNSLTAQSTVSKDSRTLERVTLNEQQEVRSIQPNLVIPQNVLYR